MNKKILFTASSYYHISNFHRPYLLAFREAGWEVHVACGGTKMPLPEADRVIFIPFEKSMTSPKNFKAVLLLRRLIAEEHYALVSCHTSLAAFFTRLAVMLLSHRPHMVNTAHGYLFDGQTVGTRRALLLGAEKLTSGVTDLLMTMNRWDTALAKEKALGRDIVEIPGIGVNFERFDLSFSSSEREALRTSLGFSSAQFVMIYAAEFSARKNQEMLIRALKRLPENVCLLLPGSGARLEACKALAQELQLSARVVFPGQLSDMPRWYHAVDAAVSASRSEGLPFNIMEAMYCALPVIASDVKGNSDLIVHGESGLLYPYGDEERFASCVRSLMDGRDHTRLLAEAGKQRTAPYALAQVLPQVLAQYERLLGRRLSE